MDRRTWGITGIISGILMVVFFIMFVSSISDTILTTDIQACYRGEITPEELGYPELTCAEIEDKQADDFLSEFVPFICCSCLLIYSIVALIIAAFKKDNADTVNLAAYSQETARLQTQLQQTQANLMQAQGSYQQIQQAHQMAEQQLLAAQTTQSQMIGQSEAAHRARMAELQAAEQRARSEMDAARQAVEDANRSKIESEEAAEKARIERLAAQGAQQQLVQAAQNIAPQAQPQVPQFNVNIVNKEYKDSVHQEEK
jgi:flagellar biosynthesis GTPase FlhF